MAQNSHILLQLCPLTHLNTPAHPVSEASLLSAGGTDHLHYATAPWFPRPTSQWRMIVGAYSSVSCSLVNSSMKSAMCLSPGSHCGQIWALTFLRDSLHCISKLVKKQEMISKNSWKTEANRYLSEKKMESMPSEEIMFVGKSIERFQTFLHQNKQHLALFSNKYFEVTSYKFYQCPMRDQGQSCNFKHICQFLCKQQI